MKRILFAAVIGLIAGPASAESWQILSRSTSNAFMLDVDSILTEGDITSVKYATVPRQGDAGDYTHSVEVYQFQCPDSKWRTAGMTDHGPDGARTEVYLEENVAWENLRANTMPEFIKAFVCYGTRASPPYYPTIQTFVDADRP